MARWKVTPGTVGNTMAGRVTYDSQGKDDTLWEIYQETGDIVEEVKRDRELLKTGRYNKHGFRKMATVPDIVCLQILEKYGLDLHDPMFMHDADRMKKFKAILVRDYPDLIIST